MKNVDRLSVTLVGPEYPINVGYTARLLKNFGIRRLYLVAPRFDMKVAVVYAAHGADVLENAEVLNMKELRKRHDLLIATTAIAASRRTNVNRLSLPPEEIFDYLATSKTTSLLFGRDTTGLRNEELAQCDVVTTIATGTPYKTLNVSHSIAILLYLLSRSHTRKERFVDPKLRDVFARYAYELAISSGLQEYRADKLRKLAKRISLRSQVSEEELTLLVFLLRRATAATNQMRSKT